MFSRVCFLLVYQAGVIIVPNMFGLRGQSPSSVGWCISSKEYLLTSLVLKSHFKFFFSFLEDILPIFHKWSVLCVCVCVHFHMGKGVRYTCIYLSVKASGQSQLSSWITLCLIIIIIFFKTRSLTEHGARLG